MPRRLTTLEAPYPSETEELLSHYPKIDGYLLKLFRVFANSNRFLRKGVADLLDRDSPLALRQREIVILRTCANKDCEYEWGVHVAGFARHAGFSEAQVAATRLASPDADCWSDDERTLLGAVDDLCATGRLSEGTRVRYERAFSVDQQLEIYALVGNYHTVSFVANNAAIEPETFAERFPRQAVDER